MISFVGICGDVETSERQKICKIHINGQHMGAIVENQATLTRLNNEEFFRMLAQQLAIYNFFERQSARGKSNLVNAAR